MHMAAKGHACAIFQASSIQNPHSLISRYREKEISIHTTQIHLSIQENRNKHTQHKEESFVEYRRVDAQDADQHY